MVENVEDVKKRLLELEAHLKTRPDANLLEGYNRAMEDYRKTGKEEIRVAGELIKTEIDRRGLKVK